MADHGIHVQTTPNIQSAGSAQLYRHQAVCNCGWKGEVWENGDVDDREDAAVEGSSHLRGA